MWSHLAKNKNNNKDILQDNPIQNVLVILLMFDSFIMQINMLKYTYLDYKA